ncbi:4-hydroxybutyrate--acetyl-CoA CoA transferase [Clostridium sp. Sa3CUN1]|uniref:4-hydroxybutyrate--acetyl-CoA CoA transferase n=1 Tax=Clostridium gallinarum TaxID=2762246 RepID=A0ABR8Q5S5_9CLOT|nr:acetyl-CoA hydrolase/transferase C-terminal domain-containing protein [Clostridium gallinarum]MBD7915782.1 4-hydroxybutyrate--acetyl-CoA CoA transferase [Clostridium gallinarum]
MREKEVFKEKYLTIDEALNLIKTEDVIVTGLGAAEPKEILKNLHKISDRVKDVTVTTCLPLEPAEYYMDARYKDSFKMDGWFFTAPMRKAQRNGNVYLIPNHLHLTAFKRQFHKKTNIYMGTATPPDKHGYLSLSLSNIYEKRVLKEADLVILEINKNYPRTLGDMEIHISDVDYLVETDYEVPTLPDVEPNEKDLIIGKYVAERINDGDCIQLGIGGIPNAVAASLMGKKDLGIHTEMFTTGMMKLVKAGVATGKKKNFNNGKHVAGFALGTKELYDFLDDNPSVMMMDGYWTNDPYVIAQNDNQVSINTTLEVDLTGQCASESLGPFQFSATGGQADTAVGSQMSKNGRSFITLYSTAMVKNKETGEREEISKIVPFLKQGAAVSLSRNDVDMVVTEYGVAELRGTNIKERVERLINIAHPKFREELSKQAKELGILY